MTDAVLFHVKIVNVSSLNLWSNFKLAVRSRDSGKTRSAVTILVDFRIFLNKSLLQRQRQKVPVPIRRETM